MTATSNVQSNLATTPEECIEHGGHCWERLNYTHPTSPPIYHRVCKHCTLVQHGRPQADMKWDSDVP